MNFNKILNLLPDFVVHCCLFTCGFYLGYYCKYTYVYDNLWTHWYSLLAIVVALVFAAGWTLRKYKAKQYRFDHFYIIFYGLICFVISCCFMLTEGIDTSFYFGFIGLSCVFIPAFSFISLRSKSNGCRSSNVALGNTCFFSGLTTGFVLFNEFEPVHCGWILFGVTLITLLGIVINEVLQHFFINYKMSRDGVFNLVNDEKMLFVANKSLYALFTGRDDFYFVKNRQWYIIGLGFLLCLERCFFCSTSFMQLTWSATVAYLTTQHLYAPYLLYTIGCGFGALILLRYKPKVIYLLFGLIKITATGAILGTYTENAPGQCFLFLCFYYVTMGVYSSIALQTIMECTPFLFTEVALAIAFSVEFIGLESLKYETKIVNSWSSLLGMSIATIVLTLICMLLVQFFLPQPEGLIDIRNYLLGIRRHPIQPAQQRVWNTHYFQHHNLQENDVTHVKLNGKREFQQYPRDSKQEQQY